MFGSIDDLASLLGFAYYHGLLQESFYGDGNYTVVSLTYENQTNYTASQFMNLDAADSAYVNLELGRNPNDEKVIIN